MLSKSVAEKLTRKMPTVIAIWIWFCAYLNCAGWALSAVHELNAGGYVIALAIWFATLTVFRKKNSAQISSRIFFGKFFRRFRKPFPLAFLILTGMAFLGGALYAPTNYDALAYRLPRILHWFAENHWHWIHTIFPRVNVRSCGMEWVMAPFIALFKTDRFLFLINFISFLFLPGLVFSVFTRLGVRLRVAWHWMWIVPTAYGLLLQAGSLGNDLYGATFTLAAMDFALRAKISGSPRDFFSSVLAAAMMTSAKTSSLPLLLPWALAILPSAKLILRWPRQSLVVAALAIFSSVFPTMVLNTKFAGDWSGAELNYPDVKNALVLRTSANVTLGVLENFVPPVFPLAEKWNRGVEKMLPPELLARLAQLIESPGCKFHLDEMQIEENAGLGFGVSILFLASVVAARFYWRPNLSKISFWLACVRLSPFISVAVLLTQSDLSAVCRYLIPAYALLMLPLLAANGQEQLVKKCGWRATAFLVFLIAGGLVIIQPARPLFPALTILKKLSAHSPNSQLLARMNEVYSVYRERNDAFAPARAVLPPDLKILGLTTFDDPETSLWRPFGSRRIEHVCPQDSAADLKARGVEYILVREDMFGPWFSGTFDEWLKKMDARVVQKIPLNLRAARGALDWYLVKLN